MKFLFTFFCLFLGTQVQSQYLKELNLDLVKDELENEDSRRGLFRNYRKRKKVRQLIRRIALEPHLGFVENTNDSFEHLVEYEHIALFEGDIAYDVQTKELIANYFNIAHTQEERDAAQEGFTEALAQMRLKRKRRDIHAIVTKVEEAAEAGYVPAILAYGVMNRHGLFGLRKNLPLAEAFYRVAAIGNSGMALGYLAAMRSEHYVLGDQLSKSFLYRDDRLPQMQLLRASAIAGGNMAYEVAEDYYAILRSDVKRHRFKTVGNVSLQVFDGTLDRVDKIAESAGKIMPSAA